MGQSVNWDALRVLVTCVLRKPRLAVPNKVVRTIADVDWLTLRQTTQARFVLFDKDNTLTAPYANEVHQSVTASVLKCVQVFGPENVAIMSNSAGTPDDLGGKWQNAIEAATKLTVVVHQEKKPLGFDDALTHFGRVAGPHAHPKPEQVVVVGDRLLTDTVMGNLHGAITIHCTQTLDTRNDNRVARVVRVAENWLLHMLS